MIDFDRQPIETDVLVAGGGIAGMMAAIHASRKGADVVVAEKGNTKRSGSGATGNDHFLCYIKEVHGGEDMGLILKTIQDSILGRLNDISLIQRLLRESFDRVRDWDEWGIPMRPTGEWEFTGHAFPDRPRLWLKYAGADQKKVLTTQARKAGARIENHLVVTDVITRDGRVVGAIAIDVGNDKPVVRLFRANCVILTTGCAQRLYPPAMSPGMLFNTAYCPSCTGTGRAIALRVGARLVNMEFPNSHAGPKYFSRTGKASWIGILTDPRGKPISPFVEKPSKDLGDITADIWNSVFTDMHRSGRGPVYMDCTGTGEEDLEYMLWGLRNEGQTAMINYMEEEGIDVRKHRVEFMKYEPFLTGRGIEIDVDGRTSVEGLYAAGDEVGNLRAALSGAATFGWIAGGNAAEEAKERKDQDKAENERWVEERIQFYFDIMERKSGSSWREANMALQQIMQDYAGPQVRSDTILRAGLKYMRDLKAKAFGTLRAENSHTLMRSLETLDLMECGEALFLTALERRETRGPHVRVDFPFTNPLLQDKFITIRKDTGGFVLEWRDKQ